MHVPYAGDVAAEIDRTAWSQLVTQLIAQESGGNKTMFAATVGVDRKTVTRWVQGENSVSEEGVRAVARALGLSARDLLVQVGYYGTDELPAETPAPTPAAEVDAAEKLIRESDLPPSIKRELIAHVRRQRAEQERDAAAKRLADTQQMLKIVQRGRR
jgi:transcriptional regulator with XRE-family HTH domain